MTRSALNSRALLPARLGHGVFAAAQARSPGQLLSVSGNKLVDRYGNRVFLRGYNHSSPEYSPIYPSSTQFYDDHTPNAISMMARLGANCIRICVGEAPWLYTLTGNEGVTGAPYRAAIAALVTDARACGLFVIIDLQWTDPRPTPDTAYQGQIQQMPDRQNSLTFWQSVANTFKGDTGVIFDVYNEPNVVNWSEWKNGGKSINYMNTNGQGAPSFSTATGGALSSWETAGMQELVTAIRATGATNVIMLGGLNYSAALGANQNDNAGSEDGGWLLYRPTDTAGNTVASWHCYPNQPHTGNPGISADGNGYKPFYESTTSTLTHIQQSTPLVCGELGDRRGDDDGTTESSDLWPGTGATPDWGKPAIDYCERKLSGVHIWTFNDWGGAGTYSLLRSFHDTSAHRIDVDGSSATDGAKTYDALPDDGAGRLFIPWVLARREIMVASQNLSATAPISTATAANGTLSSLRQTLWDNSEWKSTGGGYPATINFDLSGFAAESRRHLAMAWGCNGYIGDADLTGGDTYSMPGDYVIEGNAGAGGGSAPGSGWVTLASVTANTRRMRTHRFMNAASETGTPYNWVRIRFTAGAASNNPGNNACALAFVDVFNVRAGGFDSFAIFGDSITAEGARASEGMGAAFKTACAAIGYPAPMLETVGVPFMKASDCATGGFGRTQWLRFIAETACRNIIICFGTNDAGDSGTPSPSTFKASLQELAQDCRKVGKRPFIQTIPWSPDTNRQTRIAQLAPKLVELWNEQGSALGRGPDFYTAYLNNPGAYAGDTTHPTADWPFWGRTLAAHMIANAYPGVARGDWLAPTTSLAA